MIFHHPLGHTLTSSCTLQLALCVVALVPRRSLSIFSCLAFKRSSPSLSYVAMSCSNHSIHLCMRDCRSPTYHEDNASPIFAARTPSPMTGAACD
ncbi:hypothetical protein SLA2020_274340 [Shorea laevis]